MTAPEDSMDDRLTLQALREEMVFTRVLLGEQYATSIDAGAATCEEITAHILNCGHIAEHLSKKQPDLGDRGCSQGDDRSTSRRVPGRGLIECMNHEIPGDSKCPFHRHSARP